MVDYTSVLIGAVSVYAVIIHMALAYLYAARQVGQDAVSAQEADVASESSA